MLLSFCTRVLKHRYALGAETDRGSKSHTLCFWSHNSPKEGTVERARKGGLGGPVLGGGGEFGGWQGHEVGGSREAAETWSPTLHIPYPSPPQVPGAGVSVGMSGVCKLKVRQFRGQTNPSRRRRFWQPSAQ